MDFTLQASHDEKSKDVNVNLHFCLRDMQVDSFQEYVKPELNPQLSDFCVNLTGITQVSLFILSASVFLTNFKTLAHFSLQKSHNTNTKLHLLAYP